MKKILALFLLLLSCSPKNAETVQTREQQIDNSLARDVYFRGEQLWNIRERMEHYGVPGVSIAVIYDGEIVALKTYGIMDKETNEPVTPTTLFQAGSISKPVAAYGALKLVELGKLDLRGDVNQFLTRWKVPENEFTTKDKVTLEGIVSHTAGMTVHGFLGYSPDLPVPTTLQILDGLPPANSPAIRVDKQPGESFRYSGGGYTVMQLMMEDVYGKPFAAIEEELVLGPIGMKNSTYAQPLDSVMIKRAATGYLPDHTQTKGKRHTYPEMAAAGLWTTAEDLAKFAINVQRSIAGTENSVLSKEMANRFVTKVLPDGPTGLGIFVVNDHGYVGHGGWDEGFSSQLVFHTTKGYGAAVLTNSNHPDLINEIIRGIAVVYEWDDYLPTYDPQPILPEKLTPMLGRYRGGPDWSLTVSQDGSKYYAKYTRGEINELVRVHDSLYTTARMDHAFGFRQSGDSLECVFYSKDGKVLESLPRMAAATKVPFEYILDGDVEGAASAYRALLKADPKSNVGTESYLNNDGYDQLSQGKVKLARTVFQVNIVLYPNSANVYDSYAEASLADGDKEEAIKNYKKALALDPTKESAKKKLEELK